MSADATTAQKKDNAASNCDDWILHRTTLMGSSNSTTLLTCPVTGLRGICVETGEPLCSLHVAIATCAVTNDYAHKDDGLPHTLEHAIFLGSELYPYKGILDKLANRNLADGTNAWTATDHTCYTITTAGQEGVLNMITTFADHILHPTLTDHSFVTEVHHITATGQDKGVVYCEMQGRENSDGSLVDRAILELLYPSDSCGYSAETGGKLKNLRTLTNAAVQRYHAENYTPNNVVFILTGNVDVEPFVDKMNLVRDGIVRRAADKKIAIPRRTTRPWIGDDVPDLDLNAVGVLPPHVATSSTDDTTTDSTSSSSKNNVPLEIVFPSEDESRGTISLAWRGPAYSDRATWVRLKLLWTYLTDSAASPLQKALVECDNPVCAGIGPAQEIFANTAGYHQVWFQEVDVQHLSDIIPQFFRVVQDQAVKDFDWTRMQMVIRRKRRKLLEFHERRPTDCLMDGIIRNFLYAPRNNDDVENDPARLLQLDVDELPYLQDALNIQEKDSFVWTDLLQQYWLQRPYVAVLGRPSAARAAQMAAEETAREAQQATDLGEDKLQELGQLLQQAMEYNERAIPSDILTNFAVPSLSKVKAVPVLTIRGVGDAVAVATNSGRGVSEADTKTVLELLQSSARNCSNSLAVGDDMKEVDAYHVDWNHIESAFLYTTVGLSTKTLTPQQRLYLDLLLELAFKLPAKLDDDGTTALTKDEFVSQLQDDTVSYRARLGLSGWDNTQMISFSVQMENTATAAADGAEEEESGDGGGFPAAWKWIRRVLYQTTFTTETVKMGAQKLLSEIAPQIRHGPTICAAASDELNFLADQSNKVASSALRQWPFLDALVKRMENNDDDAKKVVQELEAIKQEIVRPENMQVFVAGNLKQVTNNPLQVLVDALRPPPREGEDNVTSKKKGELMTNVSAATVRAMDRTGRAAICSLSAIESSFLSVTCPGVGAYDPNHASLLVAIEYLTALEGDFWIKLRGAGLTYGSSIRNNTESKLLKFGLYKCTDVPAAFAAASQILEDYASQKTQISALDLESAKSSLAYNIISGVSTKLSAAISCWVTHYEGKRVDYDQWLLAQIANVTADEALHALVTYLIPLFDPQSNLAVTCPTNKLEEIALYFEEKRGWSNVLKVPEDQLRKAFVKDDDDVGPSSSTKTSSSSLNPPEKKPGVSMFMPGAFAAQFQCSCIRCGR